MIKRLGHDEFGARVWGTLALVLGLCGVAFGEIIPMTHHILGPLRPEFLQIAKYAKGDAPHWKPGRGRSFIDLSNLRVRAMCVSDSNPDGGAIKEQLSSNCDNSTFNLMMLQEPTEKYWMDYWPDREFCCTKDMVESGKCNPEQVDHFIFPTDLPHAFARSIELAPNIEVRLHDDGAVAHHEMVSSGLYILLMTVCQPSASPIIMEGSVESLDPYGYLPADLFGNLPFYGALSALYVLMGLTWLVVSVLHYDQILPLQMWITVVIAMGMIETSTLFAHYLQWNELGAPTLPLTICGLVFGVSKRAVSRIVVQLVSLGYGVVKPSLGEELYRVLQLGGGYLVLSLVYTFITALPSSLKVVKASEFDLLSMVVFLLAAIDTCFYVWIISSINNLLVSLAARRQATKYLLYRNFRAVLFVSLFFAAVWALYGSVVSLNDGHGVDSNWSDRWTVDALYELTYFAVFCAIAWMLAPSKNSTRYAYSVELSQLEDDSEYQVAGVEMTEATNKQPRGADGELDSEYGGKLQDENDPFKGTGALDASAAYAKKQ